MLQFVVNHVRPGEHTKREHSSHLNSQNIPARSENDVIFAYTTADRKGCRELCLRGLGPRMPGDWLNETITATLVRIQVSVRKLFMPF